MLLLGKLVQDGADKSPRVLGIGLHVSHYHLDIDILRSVASPAVVIGCHADHLVGDLRLACELCLWEGTHIDDGAAPGAVEV
jgi:hypothetical protein